jgi:hypothetical protein
MLKTRDVCAACLGIAMVFAVSWPAWSFAVPQPVVTVGSIEPTRDDIWKIICWFDPLGWTWFCPPPIQDPPLPQPRQEIEPSVPEGYCPEGPCPEN